MPAQPLATPLGQAATPARPRGTPCGLAARKQSGLTLIELLVVVSILAIMLGIGIPSFQGLMAQNRATSAANTLQASLQFARSTAVAQGRNVTVCVADFTTTPASCAANNNALRNWQVGWIVRLDNPDLTAAARVLREQRPLNPSITLTGWPEWRYSSTGTLATGQTPVNFELTTPSRPEARRWICMELSGSSRIPERDKTCQD